MPWQQHVADVALEIDPATGHLAYDEVVITVPRQSGKTTLLLPKFVWRAEASHLLGGRQRMLYAAQTGKDAADKFDEDFVEDLAAARVMRGRYRVTNHQGRKRIRFQSGSILSPVATGKASGHGKTLDDGTLDEAFAQKDARVEDAWRPAMITRADAQFWAVSTAGKNRLESPYLWAKVQRGRKACEDPDPSSRFCYFEWSAPPGSDPEDPATWWTCMPALGFTQTEAAVRSRLEAALADTEGDGIGGFTRPYLNLFDDAAELEVEWILPRAQWFAVRDPESRRAEKARPALAIDVSPDRRSAAVSYAALRADDRPMGQVIRHGTDGIGWVVPEVAAIAREKRPTVVVIDGVGPVSSLEKDLRDAIGGASEVKVLTTGDVADFWGQMIDAVATGQFFHTGQTELDAALAGATERDLPGGRKALDRRTASSDITPLVSVVNAAGALRKWGQTRFVF